MRNSAQRVTCAANALTAACGRLVPDEIGVALRAIYNDALLEEVPDDLIAFVQRLPRHDRTVR